MTTNTDIITFRGPALSRRDLLRVSGVAALGGAALLAGCGPSSSTSSGPVTIEYLAINQINTSWPAILNTITNQYTKSHAGTKFVLDYVPQQNLLQKIQLLAGQGALPVLYNTPSVDLMSQLNNDGEVLDIGATFQQLGITAELEPAAVTLLKKVYGNTLNALPFELNIEGFWYNKQMFSQANLTPPTTWDELVAVAASAQAAGFQPFSASGIQGWPITRLIGNYLFRTLGPDAMANVQSGQAKLTDPNYVLAAQAVADLGHKGYFGKGVATLDYMPAVDVFLQGKAAMFYMGSWELRDFNTPSVNKIGVDNIGFFPFPNISGGTGSSSQTPMNAGQPTSMNKQKYNAGVGDWLAYMAKNYGDVALQSQGAVTGFVVHNPPASLDPLTTLVVNQIKQVSEPVLWFEALFSAKATTVSQQDAAPLVTGAMTAEQFMAAVQATF